MCELWSDRCSGMLGGNGRLVVTDVRHDPARRAGRRLGPREAAVFERIEAFRRRRPRLLDEVVTLAHGAGGKASAALLDAVFLPAFANDGRSRPRPTPPCLTLPSGERLAFSTDSFVVKPLRFPGGSVGPPGRARHRQRPGHDGSPPARPVGRLRPGRGLPDRLAREIVADMAEAAAAAGVPIVTGDTKVVDHGAADGMYISTSGVGLDPRRPGPVGRPGGRRRRRDLLGHHRRSRHGRDAGPGRPGPRGRHRLGHGAAARRWWSACWPPPRRRGGCATPPGAASARSATSWPATAT